MTVSFAPPLNLQQIIWKGCRTRDYRGVQAQSRSDGSLLTIANLLVGEVRNERSEDQIRQPQNQKTINNILKK